MAKKRVIRCLILILTIVLAAGVEMFWLSRRKTIKQYKESQAAFGNPLMGYAPSAWYNEVSEDISLLYMDITWAELEPEEGVYNWASIDEENQISRWRKEGKHLVFRFVCDIPSDEEHMDIPEWLYEKSGEAGRWYDGEDGKGFAKILGYIWRNRIADRYKNQRKNILYPHRRRIPRKCLCTEGIYNSLYDHHTDGHCRLLKNRRYSNLKHGM